MQNLAHDVTSGPKVLGPGVGTDLAPTGRRLVDGTSSDPVTLTGAPFESERRKRGLSSRYEVRPKCPEWTP
ncbi:MAG: hypothetical protein AAGF59_13950, partial [Pseudomonadota bacterium]